MELESEEWVPGANGFLSFFVDLTLCLQAEWQCILAPLETALRETFLPAVKEPINDNFRRLSSGVEQGGQMHT